MHFAMTAVFKLANLLLSQAMPQLTRFMTQETFFAVFAKLAYINSSLCTLFLIHLYVTFYGLSNGANYI